MLPSILWTTAGLIIAVLTAVRVQLLLLARDPNASWLAVVSGLLTAGVVLVLTLLIGCRFAYRFYTPKRMGLALVVVPLLTLLLGYAGISRFPERNFKNQQIAGEWTRLHPTLRLALWVVAIEDRKMVLTDIARQPEGYVGMGLKVPAESQHYIDADGYARAVDLRVTNVGDLRNWGRQGLFLLMGLRTLRHTGTADHLHIALPG